MKSFKFILLFFFLSMLFLTACTPTIIQAKKYYILEYKTVKENKNLVQKKPLDFAVRVLDAEVPRIYDKKQIIVKSADNMIEYDYNNLWADKLNTNISSIITRRLTRYNVFKQVFTDFQQKADYEVVIKVNTIEFVDFQMRWAAHLGIELYLRDTKDNQFVLRHVADKNTELYDHRIELFVQAINDMIMDETDNFIEKSLRMFANINGEDSDYDGFESDIAIADKDEFEEILDLEDDFISLGSLFVPIKTDPDYEPSFSIYTLSGKYLQNEQMGTDVYLEPGKYQLRIGNNEKIVQTVEILPRYKTVVKPEWGWLTINIVDENRDGQDVRYELFNLETTESYGFGVGVKEGTGQKVETWVLPCGFYKIVFNNYPFNTYTDFATIEVKKGELEQMTAVVDVETKKLLGSGKILQDELFAKSNLKNNLLLHFNANMNYKNDVEKEKYDVSSLFNVQGDYKMVYDSEPHYFSSKTLIEQGVSKSSGVDMSFSMDKVDWKNTYVFTIIKFFGLYARQDINTHLWQEYLVDKDEKKYVKVSVDGDSTSSYTNKLQIKSPLFPFVSKTGAGFNFRVNNNLSFRLGLGLRHDVNRDYYISDGQIGDLYIYKELKSSRQMGFEASLYGNIPIPLPLSKDKITWTTNFDLLKPIENQSSISYDWENSFNYPLYKNISLEYRVNMSYNKELKDYVVIDGTSFVRFTMVISR